MTTTPDEATIADQTEAQLGGPASILTRQRRDHMQLDRLLHRVHATTGAEQDAALADLARLVFPHAFAEESVLWPLARRTVRDAPELTLGIEQEHQRINELWSHLETLEHGDPRRGPVLDELTDLLRRDVRDEEDELLPRLQRRLTTRELVRAGRSWELVRRIAPTRPHAVVSRRPPGNVLAALPLTLVDRARDRADRLHRAGGVAGRPAGRISAGLARVAGRIERAPGMRRGETPSTRVNDERTDVPPT